jgi:hypothetical protein
MRISTRVLEQFALHTPKTFHTTSEHFARLLFLHAHREASILTGELPEESEQFRFLRTSRLVNLNLIPLPLFFNSRRLPPLLNQSLVLIPQQSA